MIHQLESGMCHIWLEFISNGILMRNILILEKGYPYLGTSSVFVVKNLLFSYLPTHLIRRNQPCREVVTWIEPSRARLSTSAYGLCRWLRCKLCLWKKLGIYSKQPKFERCLRPYSFFNVCIFNQWACISSAKKSKTCSRLQKTGAMGFVFAEV